MGQSGSIAQPVLLSKWRLELALSTLLVYDLRRAKAPPVRRRLMFF
jgi:hypothetical protein